MSDSLADDIEAAPTPTVPAGPRRDLPNSTSDYSGISPNFPPPRTPALSRRNSNKSSKSTTTTRKGRSETLGTAAVKGREDNDVAPPPLPSSYVDPSAPSPTISFQKPILPPAPEPAPVAKERPGFFRRVFGSSKNSSSTSDSSSTQPPQIGLFGPENDFSARGGKPEHSPPVVSKKTSFFRRRKKSVADHIPPPLNLSVGGLKPLDQLQPEPSPVSSLRKVMNPYLADVSSPAAYDPKGDSDGENGYNPEPDQHAARPAPRDQRAVEGSTKNGVLRPKHSLNLPVPSHENDESFLADSSGNEAANSPFSTEKPARPKTSPEAPGHGPMSDGDYHQSFLNSKLSVPTQSSGKDGRASNNKAGRANKDWLDPAPSEERLPKEGGAESGRASNSDVSQYHTASNTPLIDTPLEESKFPAQRSGSETAGDRGDVADLASDDTPTPADREQARKLFENQDDVVGDEPAAAWLGSPDRAMVRKAYMELFNWTNVDILGALRSLCTKMALKGETQQVDRVLDALSARWCECNPNHGFKAVGKCRVLLGSAAMEFCPV